MLFVLLFQFIGVLTEQGVDVSFSLCSQVVHLLFLFLKLTLELPMLPLYLRDCSPEVVAFFITRDPVGVSWGSLCWLRI